jgi:hypothetical protein
MKHLMKFMGTALLGVVALIAVVGPASLSTLAAEEMPKTLKNQR